MALLKETDSQFQTLIEDVAQKIVATSHDRDGSFITTSKISGHISVCYRRLRMSLRTRHRIKPFAN